MNNAPGGAGVMVLEQKVLSEQEAAERLRLPVETLQAWREQPVTARTGPRWIVAPRGRDPRTGVVELEQEGYDPMTVESFRFSSEHARALFDRIEWLETALAMDRATFKIEGSE